MFSQSKNRIAPATRAAQALLAFIIAFGACLPMQQTLFAQQPATEEPTGVTPAKTLAGLAINADAAGTRLTLTSPTGSSVAEMLALAGSSQRFQGYDLPMQVIPLRVNSADAAQMLQILRVDAVDLPADAVQPGPPEELGILPLDAAAAAAAGESLPAVLDGELEDGTVALPQTAIQPDPALPTAPIFVVRSGEVRGEWVLVLAVSPVFQENGVVKFATGIEAFVPGAQLIEGKVIETPADESAATGEAIASAGVAPDLAAACAAYTLPLRDSGERILRVSNVGLQSVPRASLGPLASLAANQLSLSRNGVRVPIQIVGSDLRFYADSVGDRWNPTDAYVLRPDSAQFPAAVIATAAVSTIAPGAPSAVIDRGMWRNNVQYVSLYRGFDGDHWGAGDLWISPGNSPSSSAALNVVLNNAALNLPPNQLPLVASGTSTLTFNISPYRRASNSPLQYNLIAKVGATNNSVPFPLFDANSQGDWPDGLSESKSFANNPTALSLSLASVGGNAQSGTYIDSIEYARPATLTLGGKGAVFEGNAGQTQYRWSGAAGGFLLYDVTNASAPIQLTGANANGFTDGRGAAKRYLVTGTGFLHTPAVEVKHLQEYKNLSGVQAIYITANPEFAAALKPLTDLRCLGYKVAVVDVKAIYNRYSNSQVSADAVRNFLRDAWYDGAELNAPPFNYFTWDPISVVMVGDATYDPWNYLDKEKSFNLVPAYMRDDIDAYIGEAACDNCYGQLTGDDPHTGDGTVNDLGLFTMEIYVGRLPANTAVEVAEVAAKLVRYETQGKDFDSWRGNMLFLADNYWKPDNKGSYFKDGAGNFAQTADELRSIFLTGHNASLASRSYWDPAPQLNVPSAVGQMWRSNTRAALKANVLASLASKPALVLYNGHANHFHMGSTESPSGDTTREYVLMFQDVGGLTNSGELFMLLSMTCQTSQFVMPTDFGRTIDEYYVLTPNGGAFATWGSTGLSPVAGHEVMQEGFLHQLLSTKAPQTLGVLLRAGYENAIFSAINADDVLRTFMLMGDPLTKFRFNASPSALYLPIVDK